MTFNTQSGDVKMKLSPEEMYRLAGQGAFFKERLEGKTMPVCDKNRAKQVEKEYEVWKNKTGGNGGEQAFQKRLRVEDISLEEAKAVLGEAAWRPGELLPEWVNSLADLLSIFPVTMEQINQELFFNPEKDIIPNNDIVTWMLPLAYHGERQLLKKLGGQKELLASSAISNLSRALIERLSYLSFQTLLYHYRVFQNMQNPLALLGIGLTRELKEKAYADFAEELRAGKWADILLEYPVLARRIVTELANWVSNSGVMVERLARDWDKLKERRGMSIENVKSFFDRLKEDENLQQHFKELSVSTVENCMQTFVEIANSHGFSFERKDLEAYFSEAAKNFSSAVELNDEELEAVAGGSWVNWAIMSPATFGAACGASLAHRETSQGCFLDW
jgi:predicted ribosomally synthesized peptide with nif11-like leader